MRLPYHLLKACGGAIIAAQGTDIHSFSSTTLQHISTWKYPVKVIEESSEANPEIQAPSASEGPPTKRRRTENGSEEKTKNVEGATPEATNSQRKGKQNNKAVVNVSNENPFINCLIATTDGRHLVAATGSDKTIWVFKHDGAGNLKQLSQRAMPKRPCSLTLTADNTTILSADKFGDVYALPLLIATPSEQNSSSATPVPLVSRSTTPSLAAPVPFKPQADPSTVHTKRNLKALENQKISMELSLKAAAAGQSTESKPDFEHTLLLGHVSMLTAITTAQQDGKEWIITADRDEHIRVSRGIPQAYFIENFCLGHEDFVSRLCVPPQFSDLLISGGGDDDLFLWKWDGGKLVARADLLSYVKKVVPDAEKVAVSRLVAFSSGVVAVICERIPAVFLYQVTETTLTQLKTIPLEATPLDVEFLSESKLLVGIDNTSTTTSATPAPLLVVEKEEPSWKQTAVQNLPAAASGEEAKINQEELQKLLYTTESLRKLSDFD